ncbi:O-antigen ligase family protein [Chromobacterium violaceum]|uniref:O-antigen ligase family protein n=1 Tax=Chromobacterium violaceum TaxID=536 RepID=UPI001593229F|nr:O-antigen ligase family protein [Chromobacterium violaceum]
MGRVLFYQLCGASFLLLLVGAWQRRLQFDRRIFLWLLPLLLYLFVMRLWLWRFPEPIVDDLKPTQFRYGYQLKLWLCGIPMLMLPLLWPVPKLLQPIRKWLLSWMWCGSLAMAVVMIGLCLQMGSQTVRVSLNNIPQTLLAYLLVPIHLLPLLLTLRERLRSWHWVLLFLAIILQAGSIAVTGTRLAMLAYPLAVTIFLIWRYRWKGMAATAILLLLMLFLGWSSIVQRISEAGSDITQYQQGQMGTSLGIRFALWDFGWQALRIHPEGQGIQARDELMAQLVKKRLVDGAVLDMRTMHLHNDVLELGSTLGLSGVASWLLLLLGLSLFAYKRGGAMIPLLMFNLGVLFFLGLSDSILANWQAQMQVLLFLAISFYLAPLLDAGWE